MVFFLESIGELYIKKSVASINDPFKNNSSFATYITQKTVFMGNEKLFFL